MGAAIRNHRKPRTSRGKHGPLPRLAGALLAFTVAVATMAVLHVQDNTNRYMQRRSLRALRALSVRSLSTAELDGLPSCEGPKNAISFPYKVVDAKFGEISFPMAVYDKTESSNDVVSNWIDMWKDWDYEQTESLLLELQKKDSSTFLDIGANIGWFSLVMAAAGFKTYAVEPNEKNRHLFQLSTCLNPEIASRINIIPYGLGVKSQKCELWQNPKDNVGDTFSMCDDDKDTEGLATHGWQKIAEMEIKTLDELASTGRLDLGSEAGTSIIKMDVEGFEYFALKGGKNLLSTARPRKIFSEFDPGMLNSHKDAPNLSTEYLKMMKDLGYEIRTVAGEKITDLSGATAQYDHVDLVFSSPEAVKDEAGEDAPSVLSTIKLLTEQIELLSNQVTALGASEGATSA